MGKERETANLVSTKTGIAITLTGDPIILGVGNTELVRITGSGNIGIGTTNPTSALTVVGSGTSTSQLFVTGVSTLSSAIVGSAVTITAGGIVAGLGTVNNFNATHVNISGVTTVAAGSTAAPSITPTGDSNTGIFFPAADTIAFGEGGAEVARFDSSGRLLVGTSTSRNGGYADPAQVQIEGLHYRTASQSIILNSNNADGASLNFGKSRGTSLNSFTVVQNGDLLGTIDFAGADGSVLRRGAIIEAFVDGTPGANDMPGRLIFSTTADGATSPTERMRIQSNGYVLMGTTSTIQGGSARLTITANGGNFYGLTVKNLSTSNTNALEFRNSSDVSVGYISISPTVTFYATSSDYRLKENVTAVTDSITRLQQLKPSRFNFIADPDNTVDGFIAHEVQTVVPEAITGEKDAVDDEGNPQYQGIDQSKLVPLLTAALQEAIGRIEALEAEVAALKAQ